MTLNGPHCSILYFIVSLHWAASADGLILSLLHELGAARPVDCRMLCVYFGQRSKILCVPVEIVSSHGTAAWMDLFHPSL